MRSISHVHELLQERCARVGVLAWPCDERGGLIGEPSGAGKGSALFTSVPFRRAIAAAIGRLFAVDTPADLIVEAIPGCLCVILKDQDHRGSAPYVLALGFTLECFGAEASGELCAAVALPYDAAVDALRPFTHSDRPSLERVLHLLQCSAVDLACGHRDRHMVEQFSDRTAQAFEEINLLFRLARMLNSERNPRQQLEIVCGQLQEILPFGWLAIRFNKKEPSAAEIGLAGRTISAGPLPFPLAELEQTADALMSQHAEDDWLRILEPKASPLAALSGQEILAERITHDGRQIGVLLAGNKRGSDPDLSSEEMQFMDATAEFLGAFHANASRFAEQRALFLGTVRALTGTIDAKDPYTRGHSERVALLASQMAAAMGLSEKLVEWYHITGLVHDLGKVGVPEAVLCKPGKLTDEEFALIKLHPEIGYRILKDIDPIRDALPGVLHHHERWDGRGYPHKLAGENIPLLARVLALADTFDAMCSNRAYRSAMPRHAVLAEIKRCGGTQFDPQLAPLFVTLDFSAFEGMLLAHQPKLAA